MQQTIELLAGKPHGTFLFRASSIPGFIVLSAVNGFDLWHVRIAVSEQGFKVDNETYPSLTALVKSRPDYLISPINRT
jgi:hypothetical protein